MKKVKEEAPLYLARNDEHFWAHGKLIGTLTDEFVEAQGIGMLHTEYKRRYGIEDDCYITNKDSKATPEIVAADEKQDKYFSFISQTIKLSKKSPFEDKQQAATNLEFVLKPYKSAYRLSYLKESAQIKDFIKKLEEEENAADVETLGLTETVAALKEANIAFDELLGTRSAEKRMRKEGETMVSIRPKVDEAFVIIAKAINTFYIMNEWGPKDAETRTRLETVIDGMNDVLLELETALINAGVIKKTDNKKPDEGEEEETPTPEPVEPEITKFYQKEGADPDRPLTFERKKTAVLEGKGLKLVDSPEGKKAQLVLINYVDQRMPHEDSAILLNTDEKIEFTMMYDAAEGQYNFQIETYPNGTEEVVTIKYPETITLV